MAVAYLTEEGAPTWAATTIQSRVRGNKARVELNRQHAAATVIQTRVRGVQGRVSGMQHMVVTRAARRIQARQRGIMQRQRLLAQHAAAIRIQSAERGRAARAKKARLLQRKYATILQQICRRRLVRQWLNEQTAAAYLMQVRLSPVVLGNVEGEMIEICVSCCNSGSSVGGVRGGSSRR